MGAALGFIKICMTKPILNSCLVLLPIALTGCLKENIQTDDLFGTWEYDSVQLLGVSDDTTMAAKGTFVFKTSDKTIASGASNYGELCMANADLPIVSQGLSGQGSVNLHIVNGSVYFSKSIDANNYNYKNFFYGYMEHENMWEVLNTPIRMCLVSKNELNVQFWLTNNSGTRFNIQKMTLKRRNQ